MRKEKKKPPIDKEYLKQNDWWWRRLVIGNYHDNLERKKAFQVTKKTMRQLLSIGLNSSREWLIWKDCELVAYKYELSRRLIRLKTPSYINLDMMQLSLLSGALKDESDSVARLHYPPIKDQKWSAPMVGWQWKLTASDKSLKDEFMRMINDERRKRGLPGSVDHKEYSKSGKRKSSNKNNRNRGISWRVIEAIDLSRHKIRILNETERALVSKAKEKSAPWRELTRKAIKTAMTIDLGELAYESQPVLIHRFIEENWRK